MVMRLLARALYELFQLRQRVPSADDLCRCWDRSMELAEQLSAQYDAKVTFADAEEWNAAVAAGESRREQMLEEPWGVAGAT